MDITKNGKFKVGDKVACYNSFNRITCIAPIEKISRNKVLVKNTWYKEDGTYHYDSWTSRHIVLAEERHYQEIRNINITYKLEDIKWNEIDYNKKKEIVKILEDDTKDV